ncbi:MAG TPA: cytochrome C oxidase subunit IV family protein [Tepidisphaeraceae bacterium]|nr:cytochrome C oxidase subunit IV family protein [Tepidisphaeraceae bacterium]
MPEQQEHLVAPRLYLAVLIALMILLIITVVTAFINLDALGSGWNTIIAVTIAVLKGLLILLFFMHVRYASRLTVVFAAAGFVWLGIMLTLTMSDYLTRNHPPGINPKGEPRYIAEPEPTGSKPPQLDVSPAEHGAYH